MDIVKYENPSGKMTPEELMYEKYIKDHIMKVSKSFDDRAYGLQKVLGLGQEDMSNLILRVQTHDVSKFDVAEFPAYRNYFYPAPGEVKDVVAFSKAWEHHYTTNDHHPEYWDRGVLELMSPVALAEMILDWEAMSRNFGGNPRQYYMQTNKTIRLHPQTEIALKRALNVLYAEDLNLKEYRSPILL